MSSYSGEKSYPSSQQEQGPTDPRDHKDQSPRYPQKRSDTKILGRMNDALDSFPRRIQTSYKSRTYWPSNQADTSAAPAPHIAYSAEYSIPSSEMCPTVAHTEEADEELLDLDDTRDLLEPSGEEDC